MPCFEFTSLFLQVSFVPLSWNFLSTQQQQQPLAGPPIATAPLELFLDIILSSLSTSEDSTRLYP